MKNRTKLIALVVSIFLIGSWAAQAQGQTSDCYGPQPGCLDPSFGVNGKVTPPAGMKISALAIQNITVNEAAEPRIVAVGTVSVVVRRKTTKYWMIARYTLNGTLDSAFGNGGVVKTSFPYGSGEAYAVVVQPDSKLLVAGTGYLLKALAQAPNGVPVVARYLPNGVLDTSFGSGGMVGVPYGKHAGTAYSIALQSEREIVASTCYIYTCRMGVFRLTSSGKLDTTFNAGGTVPGIYVHETAQSVGNEVAIQTVDGEERIVVAGNMVDPQVGRDAAAVWRFTSAGLLDTSLAGSGWLLADFSGYTSYYYGITADATGVLAVGVAEGWPLGLDEGRLAMARYLVNGGLDSGFGTGGKVFPDPRLKTDGGWTVAIQADGRILVGGMSTDGSTSYPAIWRLDANGAPDTTFGVNGWITVDSSLGKYGLSPLVQQADGKFLTAGGNTLARYYQ